MKLDSNSLNNLESFLNEKFKKANPEYETNIKIISIRTGFEESSKLFVIINNKTEFEEDLSFIHSHIKSEENKIEILKNKIQFLEKKINNFKIKEEFHQDENL